MVAMIARAWQSCYEGALKAIDAALREGAKEGT